MTLPFPSAITVSPILLPSLLLDAPGLAPARSARAILMFLNIKIKPSTNCKNKTKQNKKQIPREINKQTKNNKKAPRVEFCLIQRAGPWCARLFTETEQRKTPPLKTSLVKQMSCE